MVASQCRIALEQLCSEAADENEETCLNMGWNVKIIRCKEAHYRILHIFSRPFSPCTLLWQPAVASLLAHSGFFLPSFFNPYCLYWLIMLFTGTITLCFVFFFLKEQIILGLNQQWAPGFCQTYSKNAGPYLRRTVHLLPFLLSFLCSLFFAKCSL